MKTKGLSYYVTTDGHGVTIGRTREPGAVKLSEVLAVIRTMLREAGISAQRPDVVAAFAKAFRCIVSNRPADGTPYNSKALADAVFTGTRAKGATVVPMLTYATGGQRYSIGPDYLADYPEIEAACRAVVNAVV